MNMACVYWIRLDEHQDMKSQGYVGVAVDFDERMRRHYKITSCGDSHFGRAIRLYGWKNLLKEIIFEGTDEECYELEQTLRPAFQIGWNEAIGGEGGDRSEFIDYASRPKPVGNKNPRNKELNPFFKKIHTEESKLKMAKGNAKKVIHTPYGVFFGFNALGKFLGTHKATAKQQAISNGWKIEDKSEVY